jgi:hypothetical protein
MKDNKLIAEFMELEASPKYNPKEYYIKEYNSGEWYLPEEMQYHNSWDWLMPVVQKCRLESRCEYDEDDNWNEIHWSLEECNLDKTYKAVVQFIKEQNN